MDEENQNQTEQPDAVEKFVSQQGKKVGRNVANQGLKLLKKAGAHLAKMIAGFVIAHIKPIIIIVAIIIVIDILLPAIEDWIDGNNAETIDEVTYQTIKEYCTIDETGIHFDKEGFLKNITIELAKNGIDLDSLGFGEDQYSLSDSNTILGNNIAPDSEAAQYLYKFVSASLAGEFPYIEGSDPETQGIIKIKRKIYQNNEEKTIDLTYMGYEEFKEKLATEDNAVKDDMMNYFSLDENWNLCIAKPYKQTKTYTVNGQVLATSSSSTYTISEVKIPYRTMVAQYTAPFLFLIDLQMVTQNATYVEAVAELMTKQSEIDFTIFDEITNDDYTYTYTATRWNKWWVYPENEYGLEDTTAEPSVGGPSKNPYHTEITHIVTETDKIKANVTKANTWIIKQETKYEMQETIEYPYTEEGTSKPLPDEPSADPVGDWDTGRKEHWYEKVVKHEWVKSETNTKILPDKFMGLWSNATGTYVKGATYLPVGKGKPGKVVKYNVRGTSQTDRPIINIVTAQDELYGYLENSVTTQMHAELMREFIRIYEEGEELEKYSVAKTLFKSMYEPHEFVESSYVGDFDVHDESLFITDVEELKRAFAGYSNGQRLVDYAEAFLYMQNRYKVNAIFAGAVCVTETGAGTTGNAVNGRKNWFNIKNGSGKYVTYNSEEEAIEAFGIFISGEGADKKYYPKGNYTVGTIGPVYCPNEPEHPTQAEDWVATVLAQMSVFYEAIGIDISPMISGGGFASSGDGDYRKIYETANGMKFIEYLQNGATWGDMQWSGGTLGGAGCPIASSATILSGYGIDVNPAQIAANYQTSDFSVSGLLSSYGLTCTIDETASADDILRHLQNGNQVIVWTDPSGGNYWTDNQHFFPVLEADGNKGYVANPSDDTKTGWIDMDIILQDNKSVIFISR